MTRRKGHLWLSKPKRHKSKSDAVLFGIKETFPNKRLSLLTPTKAVTPKRIRLYSPAQSTPRFMETNSSPMNDILDVHLCSPSSTSVSEQNSCTKSSNLIDNIKKKLDKVSLGEDFMHFVEMIHQDKFPLDIISLRLFMETVRFLALKDSSKMRYSNETKRFWKAGYRLFHGRFLLFMGGVKSTHDTDSSASINFAVPSTETIANFNIGNMDIPKRIQPGVLMPILSALEKGTETEFMLCADGKKITSGIDDKGGDVDMFNFESGTPLQEQKNLLEGQIHVLKCTGELLIECEEHALSLSLNDKIKDNLVIKVKECVHILGLRLKDCRELSRRQKLGMEKFKSMAGPNWRESRYVYVISGLQASLYQIKEFISDTLGVINKCMRFISQLEKSHDDYSTNTVKDLSLQQNFLTLKNVDGESEHVEIEPRFLKQRSSIWHELRKKCRITGSTLHNAIGLRGLKELKMHFRKFLEGEEESFSPDVLQRMNYGTEHEGDAVATVVGRILPTYFPNCVFLEEGCYILHGQNTELLGVVSPDGSVAEINQGAIENSDEVVKKYAVEIKCPYPSGNRCGVHYTLPQYYVCQCLAEMFVLETAQLLYICYSEETTTVLEVRFDVELWNEIYNEALDLYDVKDPIIQRKSRQQTKHIKEKIVTFIDNNVKFVCEVPSLKKFESCTRVSIENSWYQTAVQRQNLTQSTKPLTIEEMQETIEKSRAVLETGYNLLRRRATELMVWVLTNKNRNSSLETPCSLPIAYGLKDYKLTTSEMRAATNYVLKACYAHGLKVLSVSTDGQWIQMMTRDSDDKPLTLYQLIKDIWKESQSYSKQDLLKKLGEVHRGNPDKPLDHVKIKKLHSGALEVSCKDSPFDSVKTPNKRDAWGKSQKVTTEREIDMNVEGGQIQEIPSWIPENVLQQMSSNPELMAALKVVSHEVMNINRENCEEDDSDRNPSAQDDTGNTFLINISDVTSNDIAKESLVSGTSICSVQSGISDIQHSTAKVLLDETRLGFILGELQRNSYTMGNWSDDTLNSLSEKLKTIESISRLRHVDLNVLYESVKEGLEIADRMFRKSWNKDEKVKFICSIFGYTCSTLVLTRKRSKTAPTLISQATQFLKRRAYPKMALRSAFCHHVYKDRVLEWSSEAPLAIPKSIDGINDTSIQFWFSYPERMNETGNLICKSLDCSHNLTHLRVRTCSKNLLGVSPEAWKSCAKSGETCLSLPLVEDIIDKQSVPNARTHFSKEVETWMMEHEFIKEAKFVRLVRNWYDASDSPGISAIDRVRRLLEFRQFLLKDIDFASFPPNTRYFKGLPCVTFEGILIDIDTKIQMHTLTNTYNIRAVSSLAAESMVGLLQEMYPNPQVSIKARDVPSLMSTAVEIMTCKSNPNRGFRMRTSRTSGVYPDYMGEVNAGNAMDTILDDVTTPSIVKPTDHFFDTSERLKSRRRIKFGDISGPRAPSRGALPVRQYHKKDESKILPTKRLGIELMD